MPSIKRCTAINTTTGAVTFIDVDVGTGGTGPPGPGVPTGGLANQILSKIDATSYNTQWVNNSPTVADGSITNAKLATMATLTIKGNATGATAAPTDLTAASVKTLLALTKSDVGLANVDNTADTAKPVSTATQTALNLKADASALAGYQPVDADLTTLAGLTATTGNMILSAGSAWTSANPATVKTALSLNNVDNTTDVNKPVSTATQTALNLKADTSSLSSYATTTALGLKADKTISIGVTAPITGGGDLSSNRTIGITSFAGSAAGAVPVSVGGTANFLRADGTWAAPPGGLTQATADTLYSPLRQTIAASSAATSYTIALADENKITEYTAATAIAISVPTNATLALPVGYRTDFLQTGAGRITVAAVTPGTTTIVATPSAVLRAPGSMASLVKLAADRWILTGDLA